jgi:hypothetical protein
MTKLIIFFNKEGDMVYFYKKECQSNAKHSKTDHDLPGIRTRNLWSSSQHTQHHLGRPCQRYFTSVNHEFGWPPIVDGSFLGAQHRVNYIAWVLEALILMFHCSKKVERVTRCHWSAMQTKLWFPSYKNWQFNFVTLGRMSGVADI